MQDKLEDDGRNLMPLVSNSLDDIFLEKLIIASASLQQGLDSVWILAVLALYDQCSACCRHLPP